MTDIENKYLSFISDVKEPVDLVNDSIRFLTDELKVDDFILIGHRLHPEPYQLIYPPENSIILPEIEQDLLQIGDFISDKNEIKGQKYNYFFFDSIFSEGYGEFYLSPTPITDQIKSILFLWNKQSNMIRNILAIKESCVTEKQAGMASQLMHDIQAIIDFTDKVDKNESFIKRIEYQKKVNRNYLFWIRECELLKTDVSASELLTSSLQIAGFDVKRMNLNIPSDLTNINVDVELFSMAFNEIVKNAISATDGDFEKVGIKVSQVPSISPFFKKYWTIIQINDSGTGIPEDFLPYVMNPFFTTRKETGASGFGLANAKKILEAHHGCMELNSSKGMGTTVKLIIPG